ncbi:FAD-dependent oxidoreductase (plasmid) [Rhizobium sp. 32-5/1]|uniref:NAD(P)/FAD-dependent oxidoreductase n=1 Tax=Rhizobium sp. 32-5/1 TaxID=3019602 RepID=UPI00240D62D2|nr:FAD-dependent oxidoreductase [Rhizobium sp. 32-5/1]WEZ85353.1 FAD-dependent oxidoreductase [Rhizobium sp. 32-5/1]
MSLSRRQFVITGGGAAAVSAAGAAYLFSRPSLLQSPGVSRAEAVISSDKLPDKVDVAVIGGGIMGVLSAMMLQEKGYDVVLLEKGQIAAEQTSRAFGWISSLGDGPARLGLSAPSGEFWRRINAKLSIDTTYRQSGLLYECKDDTAVARWEQWAREHSEYGGTAVKILKGEALAHYLPGGASRSWHAAVIQPLDGSVEPSAAVPRIANLLSKNGLKIVQQCAVRGIETSAGAVSGVATERGTVNCQAAVIAGGAWTRLFMQNLGVDLPLLRIYSFMLRIPDFNGSPLASGSGAGTPWRKEASGGFSIGIPNVLAPLLPDNFRFARQFASAVVANWGHVSLQPNRELFDDFMIKKHGRTMRRPCLKNIGF